MNDKQPEALRLADGLDIDATNGDMGRKPDPKCNKRKAAAELRRQHQEIQDLKKAKTVLWEVLSDCERWHRGDVWRVSDYAAERTAWEKHRIAIQTAIFRYRD